MNLICGINPVVEALRAGTRHFDRLLVVKGLRNRRIFEAISRASQGGVPLRFEARETLDRLAGGVPHQGVIAVVSEKALQSLHDLVAHARDPGLYVVLDGVEDPRNLGAILRTAEAAGADGVLLPERHSASLSETVARASAGALEHVAIARVPNLVAALETLKAKGVWVVGFDAQGKERWDAVDLRRSVALVLGGEGKGMRRLVREHCDHIVSLPHFGHVESLNVSVAAGIALYEAIRQRGAAPSHVRPIPLKQKPIARNVVGPSPEDSEHDPGAVLTGFSYGEDEGNVEIQEEAAWAEGSYRPAEDNPYRDRDRSGPTQHPSSRPPGGSDVGGQRRDGRSGDDQRQQQRRRRRRRPQGPGGERGPRPPGPPAGDSAPSNHASGGNPQGESGPARQDGRRRRRRRRRGRPPQ